MSDEYPFLDEILSVIKRARSEPMTATEMQAFDKCEAAIGDAFIDLIGGPS